MEGLLLATSYFIFNNTPFPVIYFDIFQGYRDASCLFVEMLVKKNSATVGSAGYQYEKSDYCLCLAIHAPRKGIVEVISGAYSSDYVNDSLYSSFFGI